MTLNSLPVNSAAYIYNVEICKLHIVQFTYLNILQCSTYLQRCKRELPPICRQLRRREKREKKALAGIFARGGYLDEKQPAHVQNFVRAKKIREGRFSLKKYLKKISCSYIPIRPNTYRPNMIIILA